MSQTLDHETLFERLRQGRKLVTANSRLSRILAGEYNQWRIRQGDSQWRSPDIISWRQWLNTFWESASLQGLAGTDRAVPGDRQLSNLWEITLKNESISDRLLRPESLAGQLKDTRQLVFDWRITLDHPAWLGNDNENTGAFFTGNKAFEKRCRKGGWISPEERSALLTGLVKNNKLLVEESMDLLGFDEINPAQAALLSALIERGTIVSALAMENQYKNAVLKQCKNSNDELQLAARWARHWHQKEPGSRIAIVIPDLKESRQAVERQLQDILMPGTALTGRQPQPWNISLGRPLAKVAMIETAFDLLGLLEQRIDIQDIGRVLRSPWLKGATIERNSRALLEKCLREKYPRQLKLREVRYRATEIRTHDHQRRELPEDQHEPQAWNSPMFALVLESLIRFSSENNGLKPASSWAESFEQLLSNLGWPLSDEPGDSTGPSEDGENWQTLQAWREALRELASLDATTPGMGRKSAIHQIKQVCQDKIFQAHTAPASIQVLGLYEVNGLRFDHLWVLGLHNDNWPPSARPNPFIPGQLQTEAQSPHATPQRELAVARTITNRLLETAPDCVFSYPGQLDGERSLPSPLLLRDDIRILDEDTPVDTPPAWLEDNWRDTIAGADKPSVGRLKMPGKLKHPTTRGGSSILKNQALCPFRAFASNRLGADGLETPVDGISAMLHGSLVHSVLEHFWIETRSQENLLQLTDDALQERVRKHVDNVTGEDRGLDQRPAFRQVEAQRVYRHVMEFLALEKEREPFEVIGFEQEVKPEILGQPVRLFIDRVDRLASGDEIIIDYKTGKVEPKKWFGQRPEDPQLPLYAISASQTPAAVVFGILRDDGCLFKGVVKGDGLVPGLPPPVRNDTRELIDAGINMPETIDTWRQVLHHLMAGFLAGKAAIDPKNGSKTCNNSYCDLQSLCRIGELENMQKQQLEPPV